MEDELKKTFLKESPFTLANPWSTVSKDAVFRYDLDSDKF